MLHGLAGIFVAIIVFATVYASGYKGGRGLIAGARLGLLFGVFIAGAFVAVNYATINISAKLALELAISALNEWTIVGVLVGILYKPMNNAAIRSRGPGDRQRREVKSDTYCERDRVECCGYPVRAGLIPGRDELLLVRVICATSNHDPQTFSTPVLERVLRPGAPVAPQDIRRAQSSPLCGGSESTNPNPVDPHLFYYPAA
jgi:hypothetical protein